MSEERVVLDEIDLESIVGGRLQDNPDAWKLLAEWLKKEGGSLDHALALLAEKAGAVGEKYVDWLVRNWDKF